MSNIHVDDDDDVLAQPSTNGIPPQVKKEEQAKQNLTLLLRQ